MLPVAVGQDVLLLGNPLLCDFETTTAAGLGLAALAEAAGMGTVSGAAAVATNNTSMRQCLRNVVI